MSLNPLVTKEMPALTGRSSPMGLGLYDSTAPTRRSGPIAIHGSETLALWGEVLDDFLDQGAAFRFQHYTACHAAYRWKPTLALVIPEEFSLLRPTHRRDLSVALEVLSTVMDHYNLNVISNSPDASRLFRNVVPYSHEAISRTEGALVLLSRSLNDEVSAIRPSRYVSADPNAHRDNKSRIRFSAASGNRAFIPADEEEIGRTGLIRISVLLDEDEETSSFVEALRGLRARGMSLRLILSSRADDDFARRIRSEFDSDPQVEIHDSAPAELDDPIEIHLSNEASVLLCQGSSTHPRFLFRRGRFWRLAAMHPARSDFYLFRGEELNAQTVLKALLGFQNPVAKDTSVSSPVDNREPLISIIAVVKDHVMNVIRMAKSIYDQNYQWIEVIFVANGSPPESLEAIRIAENLLMKRKFGVRVIQLAEPHGAEAVALDLGIRAGNGDMACVIDPDDWLDAGYFEFLLQKSWRDDTLYYPKRSHSGQVTSEAENPARDEPCLGASTVESVELTGALLNQGNFIGRSGVCFARSLFDRAGGIDHRLSRGEALYLWSRCALAGGRAEGIVGRVNTSRRPGDHELPDSEESPRVAADELAWTEELNQWL